MIFEEVFVIDGTYLYFDSIKIRISYRKRK